MPFKQSKVSKEPNKELPKIDSISYLRLDTHFDRDFKHEEKLKYLKSYNNQLPNNGIYKVYYSEFVCRENKNSLLNEVCNYGASNLKCGFLFFYNSISKHAQVINIKNSFYIDSQIMMDFKIDDNYKIHLTEMGATDGDPESDGSMEAITYLLSKYIIHVDANNVIKIKQIKQD